MQRERIRRFRVALARYTWPLDLTSAWLIHFVSKATRVCGAKMCHTAQFAVRQNMGLVQAE